MSAQKSRNNYQFVMYRHIIIRILYFHIKINVNINFIEESVHLGDKPVAHHFRGDTYFNDIIIN